MLLNSLLEKENKNINFCFAFRSLNRTLPLRGEDRMRLGNKNKLEIYFVFLSAFTIFGFAEGTSFGKVQIYLAFRSLNRIFAPYYNSILTKQRYYGNNSREHE